MSDNPEPLACPFCGEKPSYVLGIGRPLVSHSWDSECILANQQFGPSEWNTRATLSPPSGEEAVLSIDGPTSHD